MNNNSSQYPEPTVVVPQTFLIRYRKQIIVFHILFLVFFFIYIIVTFPDNQNRLYIDTVFFWIVRYLLIFYLWVLLIIATIGHSLKENLFRAVTVFLTTVMVLAVCEIMVRITQVRKHTLNDVNNEYLPHDPKVNCNLGDIVMVSRFPELIYELKPGLVCLFQNKLLRTNESGCRDSHPVTPEQDGELRILGLGDSIMFGWGIDESSTYLDVLEESLAQKLHRPVTCINMAVPGYNTKMEEQTLLLKGLALQPDIVILGWCNNDLSLPNFLLKPIDPLSTEPYLDDFIKMRLEKRFNRKLFRNISMDELQYAWTDLNGEVTLFRDIWRDNLQNIPDVYHGYVGKTVVENCLKNMCHNLSQRNIHFLVVTTGAGPTQNYNFIKKVCESHSIHLVDTLPAFNHYWNKYSYQDTVISPETDTHPNDTGHAIIADQLQHYILEHFIHNNPE